MKFFWEFLKNPLETGAVVESSPFLAEKMLEKIDFSAMKYIVELGSGGGAITRRAREKLGKDALLICFESNSKLADDLRREFRNEQVIIINERAENVALELEKLGVDGVDCFISSLPLGSLPKPVVEKVLLSTNNSLKRGGNFIQFQYSLATFKTLKRLYPICSVSFVPLNVPPAFVYFCRKN